MQGSGEATAEPDLARIRVRITRTEQSAHAALAATAAGVGAVQEVLTRHRLADRSAGSRLNLTTLTNWVDGRSEPAGYQGQAGFEVHSRRLGEVTDLLTELVTAGADQIDGVEYGIADPTPLLAQARAAAVSDARAKAETYAEAAGLTLGPVLHLANRAGDGPVAYAGKMLAAESADLTPDRVSASARVLVGFAVG